MQNNTLEIGTVRFVQVQREPLKTRINADRVYRPEGLEQVQALHMTPDGIVGIRADGEQVLDAHHKDHPNSRFRGANGISIGFTAHYERMRSRFGGHVTDGIAGENIIAAAEFPFMEGDLRGGLVFENPDGTRCRFRLNKAMAPCDEFSHFVHQAGNRLPPDVLKETLQFLDGGRRGFTLLLDEAGNARVLPGARILLRPEDTHPS